MATIFVEGLGDVQIQGNIPNAEEQEAIAKALGQETQQTTNVVEDLLVKVWLTDQQV